jgi:hydroxyacylglutathione hydrolase
MAMLLKRFYDPKLAQASYLVGCTMSGEALVVDPHRDVTPYLESAEVDGLRIAHVTETHIHADFVSGARELVHRTKARLYLSAAGGHDWQYDYAASAGAVPLRDGTRFRVGKVEIEALHVPGHTPEHLTFLVTDTSSASEAMGAFTGDFIFVGDVGRPDLLERAVNVQGTMEQSARQLFKSLQRFRSFPEFLQIWPGHGAGSACGKALGAVPQSTLGYEKRFNWAFGVSDEAEFVRTVLAGQPEPPRYFAKMKHFNKSGPRLLDGSKPAARLPGAELGAALARGATVVDTRQVAEFKRGGVPGTINIPANRGFTTWAGSLLPYDQPFFLLTDAAGSGLIDQLTRDLSGIGLDGLAGYFGPEALEIWRGTTGGLQLIPDFTLSEVKNGLQTQQVTLLDVRGEDEWRSGHVPGSVNVPLGRLDQQAGDFPSGRRVIVHCQTGARAAIAASVLKARGLRDVGVFTGGYAEWTAAGQPRVTESSPVGN